MSKSRKSEEYQQSDTPNPKNQLTPEVSSEYVYFQSDSLSSENKPDTRDSLNSFELKNNDTLEYSNGIPFDTDPEYKRMVNEALQPEDSNPWYDQQNLCLSPISEENTEDLENSVNTYKANTSLVFGKDMGKGLNESNSSWLKPSYGPSDGTILFEIYLHLYSVSYFINNLKSNSRLF